MNCEQVREQLSAYLDSALAREKREKIAIHLDGCTRCNERLIELRYFDALIARLPRMTPDEGLRERILSSAEYRELTGTFGRAKGVGQAARSRQRLDGQNAGRPLGSHQRKL